MKRGAYVGIDLGTTYSLVASLDSGEPRVLPNALGELLTPSAVSVDGQGRMLVGAPARARAKTHPEHTALAFKRDMGTDRTFELGQLRMSPEELSALLLGAIKHDAETALGMPIEEAVVTVPAYFGEVQRRATRDACQMAGLHVERIINEPTAAALAYGLHQRDREMRAVVLDLGGGTFDVTVLEILEGVIEIQASAGDTRLGGEDFASVLAEHCRERLMREQGVALDSVRDLARLREASELAKCRLSTEERAAVTLVDVAGRDVQLWLEREQAEEIWQPLHQRLLGPLRRAQRDAGVTAGDIDEVLLVGGATRMPSVARLAAQVFGRLPVRKLPPDEAVALGAAVQMGLKRSDEAVGDMVVTDIAPFTLGIAVGEYVGGSLITGLFSPIIERGTVLPASRVKVFSTVENGQKQIDIQVYQGEHSLCRDNQELGHYRVKGIPAKPAGFESVEVRFTYDMNGILDVDTTVVSTSKTQSLTIEKSPGRMTAKQVDEARKRLAKLKFHPRDAFPNVTALSRAEALHVELTGPDREILSQAMNQFRVALEGQNPAAIEAARGLLVSVTSRLR